MDGGTKPGGKKRDKSGETDEQKLLREAKQRYADSNAAWGDVKNNGMDDTRFALLGEQWPKDIEQSRTRDGRPCLTINKMPAFGRQIVNDMRQNCPRIKVLPVDNGADPEVAKVLDGLIRHIEVTSDAEVAYDTAGECAVYGGFGFFRIDVDYEYDDTFDMGIFIRRIPNPQAISWDATSTGCDSSDWRYAFISEMMPKKDFEHEYPGKITTDFGDGPLDQGWLQEDMIRVAEYWTREETEREIYQLANGEVVDAETYEKLEEDAQGLPEFQITGKRLTKGYKVIQRLMTGAEILETTEWAGSYIPIVPVWGHEVNVDGRRYYQSLIRHVKDAQRMFNYWRTTATELVALTPKAPWLINEDAFPDDPQEADKWGNANQINYPYLLYSGQVPPQRQEFKGVPAGVLNEAAMASDDMKAILGLYDASLGAKSNETSGIAIHKRMAEGDVSTFHFIDNLNRGIRCAGRILIELIPQVYNKPRIIRILGEDGKPSTVPINQPPQMNPVGEAINKVFDLTTGRYDVVVKAGPSYTTQRQETSAMITDVIGAAPQTAPLLAPMLLKMSDFPDNEKVADILATMMPPAARAAYDGTPMPLPSPPPEVAVAQAKAQSDMQLSHQKATQDFQLQQQANQNKLQIEQVQAQADIAVMQQKAQAEMQIARERAALEMDLKRQEAELAARLKLIGANNSNIAPGVQ